MGVVDDAVEDGVGLPLSPLRKRRPLACPAAGQRQPFRGWPTSNWNGRHQIGIIGRHEFAIGRRLASEYALRALTTDPSDSLWRPLQGLVGLGPPLFRIRGTESLQGLPGAFVGRHRTRPGVCRLNAGRGKAEPAGQPGHRRSNRAGSCHTLRNVHAMKSEQQRGAMVPRGTMARACEGKGRMRHRAIRHQPSLVVGGAVGRDGRFSATRVPIPHDRWQAG